MGNGERGTWIQWTEAASLLGVRQGAVLRLIEDKRLPSEETSGGVVMVRRADVERLRDERPQSQPRPAQLRGT